MLRLNTHVKPLIWVESVIERHAHSRVEIMVSTSEVKDRVHSQILGWDRSIFIADTDELSVHLSVTIVCI